MATNLRLMLITAALTVAAFGSTAEAQTMYKCGKVFQDRPCDAGVKGQIIGKKPAPPAPVQGAGEADKKKALQAAKSKGKPPASPPPDVNKTMETLQAQRERAQRQVAAREADPRKFRCSGVEVQLKGLRSRIASGGSAASVERLKEQELALQNQWQAADCASLAEAN